MVVKTKQFSVISVVTEKDMVVKTKQILVSEKSIVVKTTGVPNVHYKERVFTYFSALGDVEHDLRASKYCVTKRPLKI